MGTGRIAEFFTDLLTWRPLAQATHNFLRGLHFHKDYFHHPYFSTWKGIFSLPRPSSPGSAYGHLSLVSLVQTPLPSNPWAPSSFKISSLGCLDRQPFVLSLYCGSGPICGDLGSGRATLAGEIRDQRAELASTSSRELALG